MLSSWYTKNEETGKSNTVAVDAGGETAWRGVVVATIGTRFLVLLVGPSMSLSLPVLTHVAGEKSLEKQQVGGHFSIDLSLSIRWRRSVATCVRVVILRWG